jgi:hypothetical protein
MSAAECRKLAKKIGCTLEVQGNRQAKHITIWLPDGMQVAGNCDLDCLCNEGENVKDAWEATLNDLKMLADGGMEKTAPF